uniref:Podocalyxin-like protein 2 n=1 Tax=Monopterus albus TaxID=43700 RepID=A0A3Q3JFT3_MONAL|nr:podocalyxin-like protein 2 [Monopterus albus]
MLSTAAVDMPGLLHITLLALLTSCDAFRLAPSQHVIPVSLFQDAGPAQTHAVQALVRTKRHSVHELVRAQPHLVHDMGWPEIRETSRSQNQMDSANSSQLNPASSANQDAVRTRTVEDENLSVEDEMEHMVHLVVPQDAESYRGHPGTTDPETELRSGPGAGDASQEASGFYGTDMEDRDGGEERDRRGGEEEWERDTGEDREKTGGDVRGGDEERGGGRGAQHGDEERGGGRGAQHVHVPGDLEVNHTAPDLDALIGYSPSFLPSSSKLPSNSTQAEVHDSGLQEHRASPVLEVAPLEREVWEAEGEEDVQSSGYGVLHSSVTAASAISAAAGGGAVGTATPETDTGTDFGLLRSYAKDETEDEETAREAEEEEAGVAHIGLFTQNPTVPEVGMVPSREPLQPSTGEHELTGVNLKDISEEREEERWRKADREETRPIIPLTTNPSPTIGFTDPSWDWLEKTTSLQTVRSELRGGGVTEALMPDSDFEEMEEAQQVVCVDWSELAGSGYVVLNMTQNLNCEEFRVDRGVRLLKIMERVFARRMNSPEGSWVLYLSKPTHQQHQLLMNVASEHGVIATKDVLGMLGEIRKHLLKVGIQNYTAASSCQSRPSQTRSDYGKLFVVLVIIGSICMVIITSGFIYICWQRRLSAAKTTFPGEELHFVENGCHDNPTLDVTNDSEPEMKEKKPSANGLAGGGEGGGDNSSRWQVFVNQAATEEEEEQDTHL